ncbi:MAG: hypothetical protein ACK47R_12950 [Planctomycetia bacterium]
MKYSVIPKVLGPSFDNRLGINSRNPLFPNSLRQFISSVLIRHNSGARLVFSPDCPVPLSIIGYFNDFLNSFGTSQFGMPTNQQIGNCGNLH